MIQNASHNALLMGGIAGLGFTIWPLPSRLRYSFRLKIDAKRHLVTTSRIGASNDNLSCRPESDGHATVLRTAFLRNRLHPGGQLQRFVMLALS